VKSKKNMNKNLVKKIGFIILILIVLKVILSVFVFAPTNFGDGYIYSKMARSFFLEQNFEIHGIDVNPYPPLYPISISLAYIFSDMQMVFFFIKLINAILSSLIVIPAFLIAKEFLNDKKSMITAGIIGLLPSQFSFSPYLMSEILYYPLFLITFYFMYKSFLEKGYKYNLLAGIFLGLIVLTRIAGLAVVLAYILITLIYLYKFRDYSQIKKKIYAGLLFLLVVSGWFIKNILANGFNDVAFTAQYGKEISFLVDKIYAVPTFLTWMLLYVGFLILASGIIVFVLQFFAYDKIKEKKYWIFFVSLLVTAIITLIFAANHNAGSATFYKTLFSWLWGKPLGRYVDTLLPLIFINGFIGFEALNKSKRNYKLPFVITGFILLIGSQLIYYDLIPVNNISLALFGGIKFGLSFIQESFFMDTLFSVVVTVVGLLSLYLFYRLGKKMNYKQVVMFVLVFVLISNVASYAGTIYNSEKWEEKDQIQLGLWLNENVEKESKIVIDEDYCGNILEGYSICKAPGHEVTIIGFFVNSEIRIDSLENLEEYDYAITRNEIGLKRLKENGGISIYEVK